MGHRLKFCLACNGGSHGHCLIYNCACQVDECRNSRSSPHRIFIQKGYLPEFVERLVEKKVTVVKEAEG
jgi:hypothetical protein